MAHRGLYSSEAERQSCKLNVLGSVRSGELAARQALLSILARRSLRAARLQRITGKINGGLRGVCWMGQISCQACNRD